MTYREHELEFTFAKKYSSTLTRKCSEAVEMQPNIFKVTLKVIAKVHDAPRVVLNTGLRSTQALAKYYSL